MKRRGGRVPGPAAAGLWLTALLLTVSVPRPCRAQEPGAGPAQEESPPAAAPTEGPREDETPEETARLEKIRGEIDALRQRLLQGESDAGSLLDQLDSIDLTLAVLGREASLLEAGIASKRRAQERARSAAAVAGRRATLAERDLRRWLVEMYKAGPSRDLRLVLTASSPGELAGAQRAAEALAREESRRVGAILDERARLDAAVHDLEETQASLQGLLADKARRQVDLTTARKTKNHLLSDIRARQQSGEQALMALVQVERDLQTLLQSLPGVPGGGATPSYGLPRFRGLLNWPVRGEVSIPFGNVRHPRFATQVPHPGLEIASPPGEPVRALFDGRVAFSAWFRGYSQMIVIDHGDEYLSIYGQLGERLVEAGQEVRRDQPIARTGEQGTFGATGLYFEVRHHGKAEDPVPWLRRNAGRAATRPETR